MRRVERLDAATNFVLLHTSYPPTASTMFKRSVVKGFLVLLALPSWASHFLGAEIRYAPNGTDPFAYTIEVHMFTDLNSASDRPYVLVDYGDGVLDTVPRNSISDFLSAETCGPVRLSKYISIHTYSGYGNYYIRFEDQNRNAGVNNIPNSIAQAACMEALLVIDPALGPNRSIQFDTLQFVTRWNWNTLVHHPGAHDADGDSLTFELVAPLGFGCMPIINYHFPVATNFAWLDPSNGTFLWDYPLSLGEWTLAIRGSEYRNGQLIGQVTRDMTMCVGPFFVGMNEADDQAPFLLYPSLTDDLVSISNRTSVMLTLDVISANGTLAGTYRAGPDQSSISLGHLAPGIYSIRAKALNGEVLYSTRIVRQ